MTRELATQIFSVCSAVGAFFEGMRCALFVGGTTVADNERDFEEFGAQVFNGLFVYSMIKKIMHESFRLLSAHRDVL